MQFISKSPKETEKAAGVLAQKVSQKPSKKMGALVIGLEGELGAGKTTFVKGFAKSLGVKTKISSPTFVLIKNYKLQTINYKLLYHIDAYRLKDHEDLLRLGARETFSNPENIVLIEWSDRVSKILPKNYLKIHIDHMDEKTRKIIIPHILTLQG